MRVSENGQKFFEIYYGHCTSTDSDAGWHAVNIIQTLIEHRGELPRGGSRGGYDAMEREIQYLRAAHEWLRLASSLFQHWQSSNRIACFIYNAGCHNRPIKGDKGRWTDARLAEFAGVSVCTFRRYVQSVDESIGLILDADKRAA